MSEPAIDPRTLRAVTQYMTVVEEARGLFEVTTQSGSTYKVDRREPACTCPDFEFRDEIAECKHIRRIRLEVGQIDVDAVETRLVTTAVRLDATAVDLEQQAQALAEIADDLRHTLVRLEEVADE